MISGAKQRIEVDVERHHAGHIRNCLDHVAHEDFTIAPVMSGWNRQGYWSSEHAFWTIGAKVRVSFVADVETIRPLLAAGFGILASELMFITVREAAANVS
jgi:hypothetical protein